MEKIKFFLSKHLPWLIIVLSIPAIWALFVPGFYGASDDLHIAWLHQMDATIRAGKFPPRFVPDLSFGFGYPLFNFVFPLPFYLGEIFHLLGLSFVDSIKAVFLLSVPVSGLFMYKFLREYSPKIISLAGAILYIFTPYRATDIFVRGAIGEALAFIFPPLIALSLVKIVKNNNLRWIGILGLATAGLLVSHNIMAYMFLPFLAALSIFLIYSSHKYPRPRTFGKIISGFAIGLAISIYFWLPALAESSLMKYDTVFNFKDHFPTIRQLFTPYFGYGASVAGPYDGMSFFIGSVNILLVIIGLFVVFKERNLLISWALTSFFIAVFLMNYRSIFIWVVIPNLAYFQFPWRFLSLTTFTTSILVISIGNFKYAKYIGFVIILGTILINFRYFRPHDFLGRVDNYYLNRYIPTPVVSEEYLKTGEEYLRLPKATQMRPNKLSPNLGLDSSFEVTSDKDSTVNYYKYYFPGWEAKVDGQSVTVFAGEPYGQIEFKVPAGTHRVEVAFRETPFRKFLNLISLISILLATTIILRPKRK